MNLGRDVFSTKKLLFLLPAAALTWVLSLGFLTHKQFSNFNNLVFQGTQLIRAQEGSQGVAIGHHGASSLFIKLVEADGRYQVTEIEVVSMGRTSLERTFPPTREFSVSEKLGLNPRFQTDLGHVKIRGTAAISGKILGQTLLMSFGCVLFVVGTIILIVWVNQNQVLLATASSRAELAKQVAHDIRSPLSAINLIAGQLTDVQQNQREILQSAVNRINGIAADLLGKSRSPAPVPVVSRIGLGSTVAPTHSEEIQFELVLNSLLNEKKLEYSDHANIDFAVDIPYSEPTTVLATKTDLSRVLSNLLNNAVESMRDQGGRITISVRRYSQSLEVNIMDKGCGIPDTVLERLGKEQLSFGKGHLGTGIGLFHARRYVESIGGTFSISSRVNRGTMVRLSLRRVGA